MAGFNNEQVDLPMRYDAEFDGLVLANVIPQDRQSWYGDWTLLKLNLLLLSCIFTMVANGFDASMMNGMQSLPQWQSFFGQPKGAQLGAMTFGPIGGMLISILVSSQLCDWFGRRAAIFVGSFIIVLGSVIQAASANYAMFVASRFVIGFGLGIVATGAPPLLSEVAYPTHRGQIVSFFLVTWPLGALVAAWITYGTFAMQNSWAWRLPSLLQCSFSLLQIFLCIFVPESPRWLIYKGRHEQAFNILVKWHGYGQRDSQLARFEMAEITATLEMEKVQNKSRWAEWISNKGNLHRFFIALYIPVMLQWSGNALTSYYLSKVLNSINITDAKTQLIINGCTQIWSFFAACLFAALVDKAGRRRLFLLGVLGMGVSYIIWTICSALNEQTHFRNKGYAGGVIAMIFVFSLWYHACSPIGATYIMEITPFSLRAKASMLYQFTGNLAQVFNAFANPVAMDAISWKYYVVWCVVIGVHFVLIWFFFPETKGRSLEEVAEIFDGPDAAAGPNIIKHTVLNDQHRPKPDTDKNEADKATKPTVEHIDGL